MKVRILGWCFFALVFSSCYKGHLYVQQEWVDRNFLASSKVHTPDPRQDKPFDGQRLLVAWRFPSNLVNYGLSLFLTVRFWDNVEEEICYPIRKGYGTKAFCFLGRRILTYKIDVVNSEGDVIEVWEHQFWTKLIDRSSASVSSQPKQGSVIETP